MQKILQLSNLYWRIILLQAKPQDVPGTTPVFIGAVAAAIITYTLAISSQFAVLDSLLRVTVDFAILSAVLHGGLRLTGHPERFLQGYAALCGTAALLNLAFWPVLLALGGEGSPEQAGPLVLFFLLALYVWSVVVAAHIFRHCFDTTLMVGVLVSIAYLIAVITVANSLFPQAAALSQQAVGS